MLNFTAIDLQLYKIFKIMQVSFFCTAAALQPTTLTSSIYVIRLFHILMIIILFVGHVVE